MVQLLNSIYLGAATPSDYGKAAGVVELLPFDYYLGAAVPSHGKPTINVLLSGVSPLTLLNAVSLNYVKAFGKCEQDLTPTPSTPVNITANNGAIKVKDDELPVGYKRLLDVYFDGNSYFETGEKLYGNDVVTMTLQADSSAGQNVFGAYSGSGSSAVNFSLYVYATNGSRSYYRYNQTLLRPTLGTGKRTISFGNGSTSGFNENVTYDVESFETTDTAQIGALPNSSSQKFTGYFYGNVTIGNRLKYIPCERASDSAIGYYETVNGEFLENQGTGTLTTSGYDTSHLTEIYYDGTVETVQAHGKNLFDRDTVDQNFVSGKIKNNNGEEVNDTTSTYSTTYIKVSPSTSYTFSWIGSSAVIQRIYYYTENKQWISRTQSTFGKSPAIFTTPNNCEYIQIQRQTSVYVTATNIQLELGSTATTYEPYFEGNTATCQPLLSVGTYKDSQNITNGAITRNVGIKILDGTEEWQYSGSLLNFMYSLRIGDLYAEVSSVASGRKTPYCTHFMRSEQWRAGSTDARNNYVQAFQPASGNAVIGLGYNYASAEGLADFKAWLASQYAAGTPVIVVYPLATPTTETVTGQSLSVAQGTNVVSAEGSVSDLELEVSYKAYAEVTVEEIEAVNTDENVEVTIS